MAHSLVPKVKLQVLPLPPNFLASGGVGELIWLKAAYVFVDECSVVGNPGSCGRDDKVKRGGPPWHGWRWMDRVRQRVVIAWKLRRLFLALHV